MGFNSAFKGLNPRTAHKGTLEPCEFQFNV